MSSRLAFENGWGISMRLRPKNLHSAKKKVFHLRKHERHSRRGADIRIKLCATAIVVEREREKSSEMYFLASRLRKRKKRANKRNIFFSINITSERK